MTELKIYHNDTSEHIVGDGHVVLYPDGKYHWTYEVNLYKNPTILCDTYWAFGVTMLIFFFILSFILFLADGFSWAPLMLSLQITGLVTLIFSVLILLGYIFYAVLAGGRYMVHFTMDETELIHEQSYKSQEVAERMGKLTAWAAILSRKPALAGAGLTAASRKTSRVAFADVRSVKACQWTNTIQVNEYFSQNRVYVNDEDFDFVLAFIYSQCPEA